MGHEIVVVNGIAEECETLLDAVAAYLDAVEAGAEVTVLFQYEDGTREVVDTDGEEWQTSVADIQSLNEDTEI